MHFTGCRTGLVALLLISATPAVAQQSVESRVQTVKDALVTLCLAGGSETAISAQGELELRSKIKDILTGNIGAAAKGETQFTKRSWEGIIGGLSKDMTAVQSQQATEARKCMVDNGFGLISRLLATP